MTTLRRAAFLILLLLLWRGSIQSESATAQELNPRFGVGFSTMVSTYDGLGLGFRGRASAPLTMDFSLGIDAGFTGFVLGGYDDASYIFDPQVSAIINLPSRRSRLMYVLFGLGGYVPLGNTDGRAEGKHGPTLHGGVGWVHALNESSLFYEFNPALVVGRKNVALVFPFRIGLIF
jgi:hypothetical protein